MSGFRTRWAAAAVFALALVLGACGGSEPPNMGDPDRPDEPAPEAATDLASCYAGEGTSDGTKLYATLRLTRGVGDAISGTYLVGETTAGGLPYTVDGTLKDGKLDSVFAAAGQALNVTGKIDAAKVALDNADGTFSVTKFSAGC